MGVLRHFIGATGAIALVAACQSDAVGPQVPIEQPQALSVAPRFASMPNGTIVQLAATVHQTDGTSSAPSDVEWTSTDETIATVSRGIVTGIKPGRVQILATWHRSRGSSLVYVLDPIVKKPPPQCLQAKAAGSGVPAKGPCL